MDNELTFRRSNLYPHSLGLIQRLCLSLTIQPVFIPLGEPWRNGEIESFQKTFEEAFFCSPNFTTNKKLCLEPVNFEDYLDDYYIYSCLNGNTSNRALDEGV
jgi:transposase InsO family protein